MALILPFPPTSLEHQFYGVTNNFTGLNVLSKYVWPNKSARDHVRKRILVQIRKWGGGGIPQLFHRLHPSKRKMPVVCSIHLHPMVPMKQLTLRYTTKPTVERMKILGSTRQLAPPLSRKWVITESIKQLSPSFQKFYMECSDANLLLLFVGWQFFSRYFREGDC